MHRLSRFTRIGRPAEAPAASESAPAPPSSALAERFAALPAPAQGAADATPAAASFSASGERFRRGPSNASIPLAVENDDHQPFVRCVHCHADGHADAIACPVCERSFDSDEQRRYNAVLWSEMREARREARERREVERREEAQQWEANIAREREARIQAATALHEDQTLAGWFRNRRPSLGLVLLRKIPDPRVRMGVLVGLLGLLVLTWSQPDMDGSAWLLSFGLALLFLPRFRS